MTTTSAQRPATAAEPQWDERSLLPDRQGLPWWAAVVMALVLTAAGAFVDMERANALGFIFQACYFIGCLLAVAVVARKGLFGPMVQPPLILAFTVPLVILLAGSLPKSGGTTAAALVVGTPLINGFPTMALTTAVTLIVGGFRLFTQRRPEDSNSPEERRPQRRGGAERSTPAKERERPAEQRERATEPRERGGEQAKERPAPRRERPRPSPRPRGETLRGETKERAEAPTPRKRRRADP